MPRMFGTDGVRGLANRALTAQLALDLGDAAVRVLGDDGDKSEFDGRRRALVGRDTRVSGDFLAAALSAGMSAGGFDVIDAGIIPTPGVAYLTSVLNVEMGAVISASHNPMPDNGIKFFARGGFKLPDTKEDEIENVLGQDWERPTGAGVGRISHDTATATNLYIDHLVSTIAPIGPDKSQPTPLKGLKVVADCANGATSVVAPEALRRAGADVIVINASPDGYNINKNAGSTHPEQLQAMVKASGADLGVAFDGDADRCLAVDGEGNMVNGDQIMGILARAKKNAGKLNHDTLVVTVMSNLGLKLALRSMGIKTVQTGVGDRYVLEEMLRGDYSLGGEQSGHVINREFATTGDGTLTALTLCNEVVNSGKSLKELASDFPQLPQTLINVPNVDKLAAKTNAKVQAAVEREEKMLGDTGRVLLRPSGTEPLVREMCHLRQNSVIVADLYGESKFFGKRKPSSRPTRSATVSPKSWPKNSPCNHTADTQYLAIQNPEPIREGTPCLDVTRKSTSSSTARSKNSSKPAARNSCFPSCRQVNRYCASRPQPTKAN